MLYFEAPMMGTCSSGGWLLTSLSLLNLTIMASETPRSTSQTSEHGEKTMLQKDEFRESSQTGSEQCPNLGGQRDA